MLYKEHWEQAGIKKQEIFFKKKDKACPCFKQASEWFIGDKRHASHPRAEVCFVSTHVLSNMHEYIHVQFMWMYMHTFLYISVSHSTLPGWQFSNPSMVFSSPHLKLLWTQIKLWKESCELLVTEEQIVKHNIFTRPAFERVVAILFHWLASQTMQSPLPTASSDGGSLLLCQTDFKSAPFCVQTPVL